MYKHNEPAPYGLYMGKYDMTFVSADGELLEGKENINYRRIPSWLAFLISPLLGGAFVILFPALVILAVMYAPYYHLKKALPHWASEHANLAVARFRPAAAYLTGTDKETEGTVPEELDGLHDEVKERRGQEVTPPN